MALLVPANAIPQPNLTCGSSAPKGAQQICHQTLPQGFISGFALIPFWALKKYRLYRAHCKNERVTSPRNGQINNLTERLGFQGKRIKPLVAF